MDNGKRETGLEPATACLEGNMTQEQRLFVVHQPEKLVDISHCEYEQQ